MARGTWQPIRILGKGPWSLLPAQTWSVLTDFVIFAAGLSVFYVILLLGRTWLGPFNPHVEISRDPTICRCMRLIRCCGSRWPTFFRSPSRWCMATSLRTTPKPSAS